MALDTTHNWSHW